MSLIEEQLPFFVYGTLRPGESNYHLLAGRTLSETPATAEGLWLYSLGTYPMAVYARELNHPLISHRLVGNVMLPKPDHYATIIKQLDALEDYHPSDPARSMYLRVPYSVMLLTGEIVKAWVYVGELRWTQNSLIIPHGDWVKFRQEFDLGDFAGLNED